MVMNKLFDYIVNKVWNEVNVKLLEGITSDESLKAAYKVISEYGGEEAATEWIKNLLEADDKIDPDTEVKYKNKDGEEKTTTYKSAMAQDDKTPQKKAALALRDKQKGGKEEDDEKFSKADQRDMMTPAEREAEQKAKQDDSNKKSKSADEYYESATKKVSEIYGESGDGPLLQNSETSDAALKNGYKKGESWVAPGNPGSCFNENISNEAALIIEKYPDITESELASVLFQKTKDTGLGKQQKKTRVESPSKKNSGDIPKSVPKDQRDLYKACIIAARSGKSKADRAQAGIKMAQSQVGFGEDAKTQSYGGTATDLQNLKSEIDSAKKIYVYDSGMNKVVEIPKDVMQEWVASSGGGENAADTAVISKDKNGNLIYDGWSDKKGFADIQGNSTLNDDYTKQTKNVDKLKESGRVDEKTAESAKNIIEESQKQSAEIEKSYNKASRQEAQFLSTYSGQDKKRLAELLQRQEAVYIEDGTSNHVANAMKKYGVETHEELLDKLFEEASNGKPSSDRLKVISRMAASERSFLKRNDMTVPSGLDTYAIISNAREQALGLQRETQDRLNKLNARTSSGKEKPLGDVIGFQETIDFLHLDKIQDPDSDSDHKAYLKRNTHLVMGGVDVPPKNIKDCLGAENLQDAEDNFEVVTDEKLIKDKETSKYTTGKVVYIYAIVKGGERKFIGEKRYRSKAGMTGKTSNTIQWSDDMQKCFDSK